MMVHPSSARISRVPTYFLRYLVLVDAYVYGAITLYGRTFHPFPLLFNIRYLGSSPYREGKAKRTSVRGVK